MKKYLIILSISLCCLSCGNCEDFANENFRPLQYRFRIETREKNYEEKHTRITGKNKEGKIEVFQEIGRKEIYEASAIGDTLVKEKGSLSVYILKKDTTLIFPAICNGKVIE
jgi:hypothetical protein